MGASPDQMVCCDCCGLGTVEVKCPFTAKNCPTTKFECLTYKEDGSLVLNRNGAYYYQVQCQLLICKVEYGDFFIWQNKGEPYYERILYDKSFCEIAVAKATEFFHKSVLPELMSNYFTSKPNKKIRPKK